MREKIIEAVEKNRIIVILRGVEKDKLIPLADALYGGGIRLLEITFSASGAVTDGEVAENIKMLSEHFGDRMQLGAGTVLTARQVELVKQAGGGFIISPDTNEEVIRKTRELGLVSMPGAMTPTEIQAAHRYGADFVKLFPVSSLGAGYVRAVKAPLSHIRLLAVGGIGLDNMKEYLKAGASGFGIGSGFTDKELISEGRFGEICELAKKYVAAAEVE